MTVLVSRGFNEKAFWKLTPNTSGSVTIPVTFKTPAPVFKIVTDEVPICPTSVLSNETKSGVTEIPASPSTTPTPVTAISV